MKIFVAILVIVSVVLADEEWHPKSAPEIREIRTECMKEHPLSDETLIRMKNFDFPNEESVRKYLLCTAEKMNIFCPEQGYHADRVAKQFKMDMEESEVLAIAQGCFDKNEQGSPVDVWSFRGHQCLMNSKIGEKVKAYIKKKAEAAAQQATASQ